MLRTDVREGVGPGGARFRHVDQLKLRQVGDAAVGCENGDIFGRETDAIIINGTTNIVGALQDLGAEQTNTSTWDVDAKDLNDVSVATFIFNRPMHQTFTEDLVFTRRQVANLHVAWSVGSRLKISLFRSNTY